MRIAVMCKSDRFGGGASRVGEDLCRRLNQAGHESHLYLSFSTGERSAYMRSLYSTRPGFSRVARKVNHYSSLLGLPNLIPSELFYMRMNRRRFEYDLFHFHDLPTAISPFTPGSLVRQQPIVWTFHDCSGFTGGCIYPGDCVRYRSGCGQCPQMGSWPLEGYMDGTRILSRIKKRTLAQPQIKIVTPSQWMADLAVSSGMLSSQPRVIPNGVDTEIFKPRPRREVR
ncbi:MAG: glycosyltransferase, partial [Myxococcota bacterium]|nr:glycosyltransferase [Myxococcota bacterium]